MALDMVLPALPAIAANPGAPETTAQGTITFHVLAFGLPQLVYRPWADTPGRSSPIDIGLTVFALGSVGAALGLGIRCGGSDAGDLPRGI